VKFLILIWAGLWRKRERTIFTAVSLATAFLLFGLLYGVNQGVNTAVSNLNDRVYTSAKSMDRGLPLSYRSQIASVDGVRDVTHVTFFGAYFQNRRNPIPAFATDMNTFFKVYSTFKTAPENIAKMAQIRTGALVAKALLSQQGWKIGDRIPLRSFLFQQKSGRAEWEFDIVGTYEDPASSQGLSGGFLFNYDYLNNASVNAADTTHFYAMSVTDPQRVTDICKAVDAKFVNSSHETASTPESGLLQNQIKQLGDLDFIVNAIVSAVLFSLLFVTASAMMQSLRERIPELAVLKTVGYTDFSLMLLIVTESFLLCLAGALVGLLLAMGLLQMQIASLGKIQMPAFIFAGGLGIAIVLALVSGIPPALTAARLSIVEGLVRR
jgi:putative ABC transport system permease protein